MRQLILDTETTGLESHKNHRIIEIAVVEMVNRKVTDRYLHFYLNPERSIESGAFRIHGISESFLADKPLFASIVDELLDFLKGAELIIHNAPFDIGFLNSELHRTKRSLPPVESLCSILDTLQLARSKHPGQPNNLDALCKRYQIDCTHRTQHGALLDSRLLAEVYLSMTGEQKMLFENKNSLHTTLQVTSGLPRQNRPALFVLKATEEELQTHQLYLNFLKEKSEQ